MRNKRIALTTLLLAVLVTSGCSNKLIFVTHTSLGLDVSGNAQAPDRVSLTYNRQEFAHVPEKTDGESHSVYGGLDADIGFWNGALITQTFATGEAAIAGAKRETSKPDESKPQGGNAGNAPAGAGTGGAKESKSGKKRGDPLLFTTASTYGLHLSYGDGQFKPTALMGFRRVEAAYVPISDPSKEARPLYADLLINSKPESTSATAPSRTITDKFPTGENGVRIKQSFGTGKAALILAGTDGAARAKLDRAAGLTTARLTEKAEIQKQIEARALKLPAAKQTELLEWADKQFPKETQGKLAKSKSISKFVNSLVEKLEVDSEGLEAVKTKLSELEK